MHIINIVLINKPISGDIKTFLLISLSRWSERSYDKTPEVHSSEKVIQIFSIKVTELPINLVGLDM